MPPFRYPQAALVGDGTRGGDQSHTPYRGTSLTRKRTPLGPCRSREPRVLGESQGWGGVFLWARYPWGGVFLRARYPCKPGTPQERGTPVNQATHPSPYTRYPQAALVGDGARGSDQESYASFLDQNPWQGGWGMRPIPRASAGGSRIPRPTDPSGP